MTIYTVNFLKHIFISVNYFAVINVTIKVIHGTIRRKNLTNRVTNFVIERIKEGVVLKIQIRTIDNSFDRAVYFFYGFYFHCDDYVYRYDTVTQGIFRGITIIKSPFSDKRINMFLYYNFSSYVSFLI